MTERRFLIRECAQSIINSTSEQTDLHAALEAFMPSVRRLVERPDLLTLGVSGDPVHESSRRYLYLDDAMWMLLAKMENGFALPVHDHGTGWELGYIYRGEVQHKQYERSDDGEQLGRADLALVDDRVLKEGEFLFMAPPQAAIHTLIGKTEDTYMLGIFAPWPPPIRTYYQPERGTYIVRPAGLG